MGKKIETLRDPKVGAEVDKMKKKNSYISPKVDLYPTSTKITDRNIKRKAKGSLLSFE